VRDPWAAVDIDRDTRRDYRVGVFAALRGAGLIEDQRDGDARCIAFYRRRNVTKAALFRPGK
jgi:hypothetical protein